MAIISLSEKIKQLSSRELHFHPSLERDSVFNFKAYKLTLINPIEKINLRIIHHKEISKNIAQKTAIEFCNIRTINIAGENDFGKFNELKKTGIDRWIITLESLSVVATSPIFHCGKIIQEVKFWLITNEYYLKDYINKVDSKLAFEYFNRK